MSGFNRSIHKVSAVTRNRRKVYTADRDCCNPLCPMPCASDDATLLQWNPTTLLHKHWKYPHPCIPHLQSTWKVQVCMYQVTCRCRNYSQYRPPKHDNHLPCKAVNGCGSEPMTCRSEGMHTGLLTHRASTAAQSACAVGPFLNISTVSVCGRTISKH